MARAPKEGLAPEGRSACLRKQKCWRLQNRALVASAGAMAASRYHEAHSGCSLGTGAEDMGVGTQGRAGRCFEKLMQSKRE